MKGPRVPWKRGFSLRDESGIYSYRGRRYPSVTTVLGPYDDFIWVHTAKIAAKVDELVNAAYNKQKVSRWKELVDQETGEVCWQVVEEEPAALLMDTTWLANEGFRFLKRCADRGSTVHDILADYAQGMEIVASQLPDYLEERIFQTGRSCSIDECLPYSRSLLRWLDDVKPAIWVSESSVFSDDHEYAGTMDALAEIDGELYCLDIKTGKSFKRAWMAQIAAYAQCAFGLVQDDEESAIEWPLPTGTRCAVLQVLETEYKWRVVPDPESAYKDFFLPALAAWKASKELSLPPRAVTTKCPALEVVDGAVPA